MVWGVRSRITVVATLVVLVVLALTGTALVAAQRFVLTDNVDEILERHSAEIADEIDADRLTGRIAGQGDDEAFALVVDAVGKVVASTDNSIEDVVLASPTGAAAQFQNLQSVSVGIEYRVMSERHGDAVIHTGTPLDDVNDSVATLAHGLIFAVPAAALLLAVLVWLLVGRVLRPVEEIRSQVAEISGSNLDRRVPEPRSRDEIARLAHTMNEMLDRVEDSSSRQQRFVADASHELRSPLTRIRAELEVDLAHPETADFAATHGSVLEETETLQRLVDDLLTLARSDNASMAGRRGPVDLDDVVLGEAALLRASGRVVVDISGVSGAQVLGDVTQLARAIRNVLDNAVQHGGSNVSIALNEEHGEAVLSVSDDGAGIPVHLHEQVFERFARVDEARTASPLVSGQGVTGPGVNGTGVNGTGGSGLGLAIARELVTAHRGTLTIDPAHSPGARFVIRLPLHR